MTDKQANEACKLMFEDIRRKWGHGWAYLGDDIKRAIVTERVLHYFLAREGVAETVPLADMRKVLDGFLTYCGIE